MNLKPIKTFNLPDYAEALFVYRDEMIFGIGYKVGEYCDGGPMFKVSGGWETPTHWMPLPKLPARDDKPTIGLLSPREHWELSNGKSVGSDDTWESYCQRMHADIARWVHAAKEGKPSV